jgi:hypothetical protein
MKSTLTNGVEVFNPLDYRIVGMPLMVPAHEYKKLFALAKKLQENIEDMKNEHKLHGHITDASAEYLVYLKPDCEEILK